jgi:hypothetical protein
MAPEYVDRASGKNKGQISTDGKEYDHNWFRVGDPLLSTLMAVVVAFTLTSQAFAGVANNGLI